MKAMNHRAAIAFVVSVVFAVLVGGAAHRAAADDAHGSRSSRANEFLSELLATVTNDKATWMLSDRISEIEAKLGAKYGDLSEYHQLIFELVDIKKRMSQAVKETATPMPEGFSNAVPDEKEDHLALALKYAPNDAEVRYLVAEARWKQAMNESNPKVDPDEVHLDEMRAITDMEPSNGAFHMRRAEAAMTLGEYREAVAELKACAKSPYYRTPLWWPGEQIIETPPERLTLNQVGALESLVSLESIGSTSFMRRNDFFRDLEVGVNMGGESASIFTTANRALCSMGKDETGSPIEAIDALVTSDMLGKYAAKDLYVDLEPKEKAGFERFHADIEDAHGLIRAHSVQWSTTHDDWYFKEAEKTGLPGSTLLSVEENRFCRRELWPLFDKLATFDFDHPELYGWSAGITKP